MFRELKEVVLHLDVNSKTKRRINPDLVKASPEVKPRERWHAYELYSCCFAFCMSILAEVPSIQKKRPVQKFRKLVIKISLGDGNQQFKFLLWKGRGGVWTFLIFLFLKNLFLVTYNFIKLELFRINFFLHLGSVLPSLCLSLSLGFYLYHRGPEKFPCFSWAYDLTCNVCDAAYSFSVPFETERVRTQLWLWEKWTWTISFFQECYLSHGLSSTWADL